MGRTVFAAPSSTRCYYYCHHLKHLTRPHYTCRLGAWVWTWSWNTASLPSPLPANGFTGVFQGMISPASASGTYLLELSSPVGVGQTVVLALQDGAFGCSVCGPTSYSCCSAPLHVPQS